MKVQQIEIAQIKVNPNRFREAEDVDGLANSLLQFGQLQPIIIDNEYNLLDGLRRLSAARANMWTHISGSFKDDVDEVLAREIELETNIQRAQFTWLERAKAISEIDAMKRARDPNWSQPMTAATIGSKRQADVSEAIKVTAMAEMFPEIKDAKSQAAAYNIATRKAKMIERRIEAEAQPIRSDYESLIHLGDAVDFIKTLPDSSIDHCVTDPPFGVAYDERIAGTSHAATAYQDDDNAYKRILSMVPDIYRTLRPGGFCIFFYGMSWHTEVHAAFVEAGFVVDPLPVIWDRSSGRTYTNRPDRYFTRGYDVAIHAFKGDGTLAKQGGCNILRIEPVGRSERETLVERPVELYAELIRRVSQPGEIIADFFVGSGSCPAAAVSTGRKFIGSELDADRRAYAIRKIEAHRPT